jgi:nucleoside-diphosphate-sugar epimerase
MRALIIGGTRNLGPGIVTAFLERGYSITVFNRGQTPDDLPRHVERLHGDRSDQAQLRSALAGREFDVVVDTTLYNGEEAEAAIELFSGRAKRYIFLSTGQVYLVRTGVQRPFKEKDYPGPIMAEPPQSDESEHSNWAYGFHKRAAEDAFARAWAERGFPYTSLRLPMVNSERDHYDRIYGYFLRVQDGGPLLLPEDGLPVRHVYGDDVVRAIVRVAQSDLGKGEAYNIGQDETVSLEEFLQMLAASMQRPLKLVRLPRARLEREGLLPECSPFSGLWMSSLDNTRSKRELGMEYTSMETYVEKLVKFFQSSPQRAMAGYARRSAELALGGAAG